MARRGGARPFCCRLLSMLDRRRMIAPELTPMTLRPSLIACLVSSLALSVSVAAHSSTHRSQDKAKPVTFTADIAPLLAAKCQPCHFKGGKVFEKLPFDQYKTVAKIAPRLHTRLKRGDEHLVARWIAQGAPAQVRPPP